MTQAILLPPPIRFALRRIGRRLLRVSIVRALGLILVVGSAGMILGMALDFAFALPSVARFALFFAWIAMIVATWLRSVSSRSARSPLELAALVERKFPDFGERLTASIGLVRDDLSPRGSPALIAEVVREAAERIEAIDPASAVPSKSASRRFGGGLAAALILALPLLFVPDPFGKLALRFLTPLVGS